MSERAITTIETERVAKLIRLIFSSDKSGEIIAAVTAAKRVLDNNGRDAHWLADSFERGATSPVTRADDHDQVDDDDGRPAIWFCWHRRHRLSEKERAFIERIRTWRGPLSEKQRIWLRDICDRLEAR
jgi:DNA-binding transcriptional LysR family regulator